GIPALHDVALVVAQRADGSGSNDVSPSDVRHVWPGGAVRDVEHGTEGALQLAARKSASTAPGADRARADSRGWIGSEAGRCEEHRADAGSVERTSHQQVRV